MKKRKCNYRSFRTFDENAFCADISNITLLEHVDQEDHMSFTSEMKDYVNERYNNFERKVTQIVDKHVPMKQRYERKNRCPYMNKELRQAIYRKHMLYNKYLKNKSTNSWEKYRTQRNFVTKLKKKSESVYFSERCIGGSKSTDFWSTIKPYFSKRQSKINAKLFYMKTETWLPKHPK